MKIVIIEDEKPTANHLAKTIQSLEPSVEIVAMLESVEDALAFFAQNKAVDLIFSDIELGDGLSFEIFEQSQLYIPIIFCTAYNQYALDAFKTSGIDYILKPFNNSDIERTLLKYKAIQGKMAQPNPNLNSLIQMLGLGQASPAPKSILINQGDKIIPLAVDSIALFFIEDAYTFAYTFEGKKHILNQNMDQLEMSHPSFFRANRQYLINRAAVKDASQYFHRKIEVNLKFEFTEQILVGKLKVSAFMAWLAS